ncbi:multiple monosaccharide ABC transporter permease [Bacteroides acidifaciens]|uniref:multiple monosaccharide ABC transporter permease n=1 Tax=Bacteroides acidifaciens TaxID=85831 RepID=UPI0025852917|nr:multiple monosaccharide ABC transporter permease [Bacteroides acidifaciens]
MKKVLDGIKNNAMVIALLLVIVFFSIQTQGKILSPANFNNLIAQNAYLFLLGAGMLVCMLTGGNIDLSVGSLVALIGSVGATIMVTKGMPIPLAILAMIAIGIIVGVWQGFWIAYMNIPPWIVTLAGFLSFRGLATAILKGLTIAPIPPSFVNVFNGSLPDIQVGNIKLICMLAGMVACVIFVVSEMKNRAMRLKKNYEVAPLGNMVAKCVIICAVVLIYTYKLATYMGLPYIVIWLAVILLAYNFVLSKTTLGRSYYAMGGNPEAARLSGIDTKKIYFMAYLNMALLATFTGMVVMARLTSATPTAGTNFEMDAISACMVGGVSAYGGAGTIPGMMVGAALVGVINLGMSIMGVDANWQKVVKGVVLLVAVVFDIMSKKKGKKS